MPFQKRTVDPQLLCRMTKERIGATGRSDFCSAGSSGSWTSHTDVSSTALKNVLLQLSDLSRHACSVFLEVHDQVSEVAHRSAALQLRLDTLQDSVRKLDHKKTKIRKYELCSVLHSVLYHRECWTVQQFCSNAMKSVDQQVWKCGGKCTEGCKIIQKRVTL